MHKKLLVALSAVGILTLAGCGESKPSYQDLNPPLSGDYVADFSQGESEEVFASDGWSNGQPFNAVWKKENISYADGKMKLTIKDEDVTVVEEEEEVTYPYSAAEARTHKLYGYGDFQVRMKPSKAYGSVTTFFTYTDEWNKTGGVANKHDEIDIEFLGKDTTKVQFHYYVGGVSYPEYMYDLGFDASLEFHTYGFRWEEDCISWTVDGKTAYQVKGDTTNLPSMPGRIMASYWPSSAAKWSGLYTETNDTSCEYEWIKSNAPTSYVDGEEPVPAFDEEINWSEVEAFDNDFWNGASGTYTMTEVEKGVEVTYSEAANWACVGTYIGADAAGAEAVNVTLKNKSNLESTVKVDAQGTTTVGNTNAINVAAYADKHSEVTTDVEYGGSKIVLAAGEEVDFKIKIDQTTDRGALTNLAFFVDSLQPSAVAHAGGDVVIKDIKLAKLDGTPIVPPQPVPPAPQPTGDVDWDKVDATALEFWASDSHVYTFENNNTTAVTVNYTDAKGYVCIGSASANALIDANNTAKVTIKNNGAAPAHVRFDLQLTGDLKTISAINAKGAEEAYVSEGSAFVTIGVNGVVDVVVTYEATAAATNIMFFIDSMQDEGVSGSVTISDVKFAKVLEPAPGEELELTFNTENDYTLDPKGVATASVDASYVDMVGGSYQNFYAPLSNVEGMTQISIKIKNNGENSSKVRVDVEGTTQVENTKAINVSGSAEGHTDVWTDLAYGGTYISLVSGEEVTLVITFDQTTERGAATLLKFFVDSSTYEDTNKYTGSVTLSNFVLA